MAGLKGALSGVTETLAHTFSADKKDDSKEDIVIRRRVETTVPWVAGGIAGITGLLLLEPIHSVSSFVFKSAAKVATGFGLFEKIPLIGGIFTALGNGISKLGEYAAYIAPAIAAFIGYKAFQNTTPTVTTDTASSAGTSVAKGNTPKQTDIQLKDHQANQLHTVKAPTELADNVNKVPLEERIKIPNANTMSVPEIRRAIENADKNSNILRMLWKEKNQAYMDTREYAKFAQTYNEGATGGRKELIAILKKNGLGDIADSLVPMAPVIRQTIQDKGEDMNIDKGAYNSSMKAELNTFASQYEQTFGKIALDIGNNNKKLMSFSECSNPTQQQEWLDRAIEGCRKSSELIYKEHYLKHRRSFQDAEFKMQVHKRTEGHVWDTIEDLGYAGSIRTEGGLEVHVETANSFLKKVGFIEVTSQQKTTSAGTVGAPGITRIDYTYNINKSPQIITRFKNFQQGLDNHIAMLDGDRMRIHEFASQITKLKKQLAEYNESGRLVYDPIEAPAISAFAKEYEQVFGGIKLNGVGNAVSFASCSTQDKKAWLKGAMNGCQSASQMLQGDHSKWTHMTCESGRHVEKTTITAFLKQHQSVVEQFAKDTKLLTNLDQIPVQDVYRDFASNVKVAANDISSAATTLPLAEDKNKTLLSCG